MSTFLLDANLSPNTAAFLRETFGFDVLHQREVLPGSPTDAEIVAFATRERRVIITFDQRFGEQCIAAFLKITCPTHHPTSRQAVMYDFESHGYTVFATW